MKTNLKFFMLKKQHIILMLIAVIFTPLPLFAMDQILLEDKVHICSLCKPKLQFELTEVLEKNEDFHGVPQEIIILFLENLWLKDMITWSRTSKAMYNLCHQPSLWDFMAQKYSLALIPNICVKMQLHLFFSLFSREDQEYKVSQEQFEKFMERPCQTTWWISHHEKDNYPLKTYSFSIGRNQYELFVRDLNQAYTDFKGIYNNKKTFYPTTKKIKIYSSFEPDIFSEEHVFKDKQEDCALGKAYVRKIEIKLEQ